MPTKDPKKAARTITGGKRKAGAVSNTAVPITLGPNPTLKQLDQMTKRMDTFTGAVATLRELVESRAGAVEEHCSTTIARFDAIVVDRNTQIENLTREFQQTSQSLREFGLSEAAKIAATNGKDMVDTKELATLRQNVTELRDALASQADEIRGNLKAEFAAKLEAATSRIKLTEAKEHATIDAQHKAAQGEIRILKEQLEHAHWPMHALRSPSLSPSSSASRSDR